MPTLAYVRWLDACYQDGEHAVNTLGEGIILEHYGVLIKETPETVVISVEVPHEGATRNPFTIPRQNIKEFKTVDAKRAFRSPRAKKTLPACEPVPVEERPAKSAL